MINSTKTRANGQMAKKQAQRDSKPAAKGAVKSVNSVLDANPALKNTIAQIEKQFGEGAIMALGEDKAVQIAGIPTGSLSLDLALGGQGVPRGRIVEIFGP